MIYVMSDLHGELNKFKKMLSEIRFSTRDEMYILGNMMDYGADSIPLIEELMMHENIYPILGEREYRFLKCFYNLPSAVGIDDLERNLSADQNRLLQEWIQDGGYPTISEFLKLNEEDKEALTDYLKECSPFEEAEVCGQHYLLTGGGLKGYVPGQALEEYSVHSFIHPMTEAELSEWDDDRILIFGNKPVQELKYGENGMIYFADSYIGINCDVRHPQDGGRLGCLRLGDERDFYVD